MADPWLQSINKIADIIETQHSKVDLSKVLGIKAFDLEKMLEQDPDFLILEQVRRPAELSCACQMARTVVPSPLAGTVRAFECVVFSLRCFGSD